MAQVQLNDSQVQETSLYDQSSQLDESRPPDPPDPSFSVRSDDQPSISLPPNRATGTLDPSLSLLSEHGETSHEQPSLSLSPTRATGCLYDNVRLPTIF